MAGASILSGALVNDYLRQLFFLRSYGRMSTFIPITIIPPILAMMSNQYIVGTRMLADQEQCPVCTELTSAGIQTVVSVGQTWCMGFLSCCYMAKLANTYTVPKITQYRKLFKLFKKMTHKGSNRLIGLTAFNVLVASVVTMYEGKQAERVWQSW